MRSSLLLAVVLLLAVQLGRGGLCAPWSPTRFTSVVVEDSATNVEPHDFFDFNPLGGPARCGK